MKTRHLTNGERLLLKSALQLAHWRPRDGVELWEEWAPMGKQWLTYQRHIEALLVLVASPCDIDIHFNEGRKL